MEQLQFNFEYEERANGRRKIYKVKEKNNKNESLLIELSYIIYEEKELTKNSLPVLWNKYGYTNKLITNYINIECEVIDEEGNSYNRYNPMIKLSEDKYRHVINFDKMYEISEENKIKILNECYENFKRGVIYE